eukprot:6460476-Amphidinium_carterae.1
MGGTHSLAMSVKVWNLSLGSREGDVGLLAIDEECARELHAKRQSFNAIRSQLKLHGRNPNDNLGILRRRKDGMCFNKSKDKERSAHNRFRERFQKSKQREPSHGLVCKYCTVEVEAYHAYRAV